MIETELLRSLLQAKAGQRLIRLIDALNQQVAGAHALVLLRYEEPNLLPQKAYGLDAQVLTMSFKLFEHPRLAAVMAADGVVVFGPDYPFPDPFDELWSKSASAASGDCGLGVALYIREQCWGMLMVDALATPFAEDLPARLGDWAVLCETAIQMDQPVPDKTADEQTIAVLDGSLKTTVDDFQRRLLTQQLADHRNNWTTTARTLGIDASNLHKLAKRLGMKAER